LHSQRRGSLPLGTIGRTGEQKDPLTLYRAFARLAGTRPDVTLFHIGCGELDTEIVRFIAAEGLTHRVVRRDYLSTPVDFYQAVDGFILTSRYEGFSLALLEALACDLPLILSEAPGNGDVLSLPLSQLWSAPVGDDAAFAVAMGRWAGDRSQPRPPRLNHRGIAREWFDSERCFRQVLGLYQDLLSPRVPAAAEPDPLVVR
jgi:glycosyltransferase involved in cell wall biosynthesis